MRATRQTGDTPSAHSAENVITEYDLGKTYQKVVEFRGKDDGCQYVVVIVFYGKDHGVGLVHSHACDNPKCHLNQRLSLERERLEVEKARLEVEKVRLSVELKKSNMVLM